MKRKKKKRHAALNEKYPPSESCSGDTCRAFCMRPGWWTVEEAARVMAAGYGNRMMMEISPEYTFAVLQFSAGRALRATWNGANAFGMPFLPSLPLQAGPDLS